MNFDWDWGFALQSLPTLLRGLVFTLEATFFGSLLAFALGLPLHRVWGRVVLPQAMRFAVPVLGNFVISMFKESAILSTISVLELIGQANILGAETARYVEPLTMAALIFLVISYPAARLVRLLEARTGAA